MASAGLARQANRSRDAGPLRAEVGAGYIYRALIALDHLATVNCTPDELADALRVHRRTALRLLEVMTLAGFAQRDAHDPQRFAATTKIVTIAGALMLRLDIVKVGYPYVTVLRDRTNEASHLALPSQGTAVQVIQETSFHRLAVKPRIGEQTPMHSSAVGKALAAFLPEEAEAACRSGLPAFTHRTITSRDDFDRELRMVRRQGYAVDDEEMDIGTRCLAAPVRDGFGQVIAAIGASGPSVRMTRGELPRVAAIVMEEAARLSRALGYRERAPEDSLHRGTLLRGTKSARIRRRGTA